jgi:hypothetical protein
MTPNASKSGERCATRNARASVTAPTILLDASSSFSPLRPYLSHSRLKSGIQTNNQRRTAIQDKLLRSIIALRAPLKPLEPHAHAKSLSI